MLAEAYLAAWHAAINDEAKERFNSFLDTPQELCGETVRVMRLKDWCKLRALKSPVVCGGEIEPEHIAAAVWLLSPLHTTRIADTRVFAEFIHANIAERPWVEVVREVDEYVQRVFLDAPSGGGGDKPAATPEAGVVDRVASEYPGLTFEYILEQPLPRLFDLFRAADVRKTGKSLGASAKVAAAKSAYVLALNSVPPEERKEWQTRQRQMKDEWRASLS